MLDKFLNDHAVMRERGWSLIALLDLEDMPDPQLLAETRWRLSGQIMQHLALKERYVYAKLVSDPRPHVRAKGESLQQELSLIFQDYVEQGKYWTQEKIATDWNGYRRGARERVFAMFSRLEREEAELIPLISDSTIEVSTQVPHSSNWAREAFALKDAITKAVAER